MKRKPGRPKLSDDERRTEVLRIRVTKDEMRYLSEKAFAQLITVSEYVRRRILPRT